MDYFKKAQSAFSVRRLLSVDDFQREYQEALARNPLLLSDMRCRPYEEDARQCVQQRGQDDEECQKKMLVSLLCVGQFLVPSKYATWEKCTADAGDDWSKCEDLLADTVQSAQRIMEKAMSDIANPSPKEVDLIQKFEAKCNPSKNSEGDFERTLECAATVACAAEWEGFRSCLDANAGEYDAKPCKVPGNLFARCLGDRGTKLLLQHDHTHSE